MNSVDRSTLQGETDQLLAAVLFAGDDKNDQLMGDITEMLRSRGYRVGGVVPSDLDEGKTCRCEMKLEELASGKVFSISQDLGDHAKGCRLNSEALEHIAGLVESSVYEGIDVLIVNKFGKREAEGKGLRSAIAIAYQADIPVVVGVSGPMLSAWNEFCGGNSTILAPDADEAENWVSASINPGP